MFHGDSGDLKLVKANTTGTNYINAQGGFGSEGSPYKATLQTDGNFVIYDRSGKAVWATDTSHKF